MNTVVEVARLSKNYQKLEALKDLSFHIKKGECAGLLGPNGAGKSTTVQVLLGSLVPSEGKTRVFGANPAETPKAVHAVTGYVPDTPSLYEDLTVYQNIDLFRRIYREPKQRTWDIIKKMNLEDKSQSKAKQLSKGLLQRLLIARSLVHIPQFLIMDEPTVALDPSSTDFICKVLEELKSQGVTMLLCTHLMSLAEKLCDRIILLNKGKKIEEGALAELKKKYGDSQLKIKLKEKGGELKTVSFPMTKNFIKELEKIQKTGAIVSINTNEPSLEEIFIRLIKDKKQ